ncbi:MAG: glycosyltransferase, partial [Candidatus Nanopelagicales bacterium]
PTLSLLTAVHPDRDEYLSDTAASVAATKTAAARIGWTVDWIVVFDGPTNRTPALPTADLVKVQPHHRGVSAARNVAHRYATGDWVTPLDGDDVLDPNGITSVLSTVTTGEGWIATNRLLMTGHRTRHWISNPRHWAAGELAEHWTAPMNCHPNSVIAERQLVTHAGLWPEHLDVNEDLAWLLALSEHSPGRFDPTVTLHYRVWHRQVVADPFYPERKGRAFHRIEHDINAIRERQARRPIRRPSAGGPYGTMTASGEESIE